MADAPEGTPGTVDIEVAYATSDVQAIVGITTPQGTTAGAAVRQSGLLARFPGINGAELHIGIFGVACKPEQVLRQGDRVEIYRPLLHDPKDARRQRALNK